jgi:hypothetical protein
MIEAAKTTASAGEVWAIVIVAVCCLAFWLSMVAWADRNPIWRGRQISEMEGPVLGGMHVAGGGRSVSPNREAPSVLTNVDDVPYDQRDYEPEHEEAAQWREAAPGTGEFWIPVQRGPEPYRTAGQPEPATGQTGAASGMPAQRTAEADRAERSAAGPADRDTDESGAPGV